MARHFATDLVDYRAPFADADLEHLRAEYARNPAELTCPHCRPGAMEIIGFVEPEPDSRGFATPAEPLGAYVILLRCVECGRGGSLRVDAEE
ncbi:MAG TPA: hypothetical protein VFJ16_23815 [Longimicrobium sp.]|nr:hypothetical protein [Longimicrobium sp.]